MNIKVTITQQIPNGLLCKGKTKCSRLERDGSNYEIEMYYCSLFNKHINNDVKCEECLIHCKNQLEKGE